MNTIQLKLKTDASLIASEVPTQRVLEIELTAPAASGKKDAAPLNLALVVDRSGSMSDGKLEQAKEAVAQILDLMREKDSVSIVQYDNAISITAEADSVTQSARQEMKTAVSRLHPGGSTDLGGGWLLGCERVAARLGGGKVSRALLLTDGQANQGITSPEELGQHAAALFERGVATSTFGIGEGFNEHLLEAMANRGGGNFYYIAQTAGIQTLLLQEFHDLAAVTVKNAVVEINLPAGVGIELFGEWRANQEGQKVTLLLSDLAANREVNLFARLLTPPGSGQLVFNVVVSGLDEDDKPILVSGDVTLQYAAQDKVTQARKDADLVTRFSSVAVGQLTNDALKLERLGETKKAHELMERLMMEFGVSLPTPTRTRYEFIRDNIESGLSEPIHKNTNMDSYLLKKHRHPDQQGGEQK